MGGFSNITGDPLGTIMNADNVCFDGTARGTPITTDGQLLIGSSTIPHIRVGTLASSDSSVTITNGNGTIDLKVPKIQFAQVNISSAAFKNINAVPVQLLPAPASGSVDILLGMIMKLNYGGNNAFTTGGSLILVYGATSTTFTGFANSNYTGTSSIYSTNYSLTLTAIAKANIEGLTLNITTTVGNPGGNAAGDNSVSFGVWYQNVTLI